VVLLLALLAALSITTCGARGPLPGSEQPVNFAYRLADGPSENLAGLRGRPLVLVLLRVSELTSELYLREVVRAYERVAGKTRFLVLSIEPTEEVLLGEFAEFNELPFPIGLAEWSVATGESGLGSIPVTPTTYFVDPSGRVVAVAPGALPADHIEAEIRRRRWQ
jgi:hypothetical protein